MADKLKNRYKDQLILWRYGENEYIEHISNVSLSMNRIQKLNHIQNEELRVIAELIIKHQCSSFQESFMDSYIKDIMNEQKVQ